MSTPATSSPGGTPPQPHQQEPLFLVTPEYTRHMVRRLTSTDQKFHMVETFKRDLLGLLKPGGDYVADITDGTLGAQTLDIFSMLRVSRGHYPARSEFIVQLLADDLLSFIRDSLIEKFNLVFFDKERTGEQYIARLRVEYRLIVAEYEENLVEQAYEPIPHDFLDAEQYGMTVVAQWSAELQKAATDHVARHRYFFDWISDATYLSVATATDQQVPEEPVSPATSPAQDGPPSAASRRPRRWGRPKP